MSDYYGTVHFLTSIPCWNILYQGVKHFKRGYETFWTVIFGGMKHIQNFMKIGGTKILDALFSNQIESNGFFLEHDFT